jgi:ParB family chromosome partitioning protein
MNESKLSIDALLPYPDHPFALYEGKRMDDMIESIREYGVISPIVVRPVAQNKYEILSGHNRVEAAMRAGLTEVPAIVKIDLSDDEAALIVTESNLIQRSFADLKHSERAVVLKNHLEAMKKLDGQGKRNDLLDFLDDKPGAQVAHKSKSRDRVAEQYSLSKDTVMRYIRLTKLPKEMLYKVDSGKLKFIPAVDFLGSQKMS